MLRPICSLAVVLMGTLLFPGCAYIAAQHQRMNGAPVAAEYRGLDNKTVAIIVYSPDATSDEFPAAREEISAYVATMMRLKMPSIRMVNYKEVINWQDDTINWFGLSERDIAKHFAVDRLMYIEVLDYSSKMPTGYGDLQGHLRANVKIFEAERAGDAPAWTTLMDVRWPKDRPVDPNRASEIAVRKRTLEIFSDDLTNKLYDHKEFDRPMSERN